MTRTVVFGAVLWTLSMVFFVNQVIVQVDEKFTSGPNTFSNADDPAQVEFPIKQPTGAQLSTRVDRENRRLSQALADARKQAKDEAGTARAIAIVGLVVSVLASAPQPTASPGSGRSGRRLPVGGAHAEHRAVRAPGPKQQPVYLAVVGAHATGRPEVLHFQGRLPPLHPGEIGLSSSVMAGRPPP